MPSPAVTALGDVRSEECEGGEEAGRPNGMHISERAADKNNVKNIHYIRKLLIPQQQWSKYNKRAL